MEVVHRHADVVAGDEGAHDDLRQRLEESAERHPDEKQSDRRGAYATAAQEHMQTMALMKIANAPVP